VESNLDMHELICSRFYITLERQNKFVTALMNKFCYDMHLGDVI